jgi:hypothetical protein
MRRYILDDDECAWAMGNVTRETDRYERGTRIEDCGFGVFRFRGGAQAGGGADGRRRCDGGIDVAVLHVLAKGAIMIPVLTSNLLCLVWRGIHISPSWGHSRARQSQHIVLSSGLESRR